METENLYLGLADEKIDSIMKKFLSGKKGDPDNLKYYQVIDNVDYYATTVGSAAGVIFKNKYDKRDGSVRYIQPLTKGKREELDHIDDFYDIKDLFDVDLSGYYKLIFGDIEKIIKIYEAIDKIKKYGGIYHSANFEITDSRLKIYNHHNDAASIYSIFDIDNQEKHNLSGYHHNPEYMLNIWKSIKDLKLNEVVIHYKNLDHPIFVVGEDTDYVYKFAINRLMVREVNDPQKKVT